MTALNLPDVGLKLNLMQRSPETLSSTLVNYLKKKKKKRSFGLHNLTQINEEYEKRMVTEDKCLLTRSVARLSRSQQEESAVGVL